MKSNIHQAYCCYLQLSFGFSQLISLSCVLVSYYTYTVYDSREYELLKYEFLYYPSIYSFQIHALCLI